MKRFNVIYRDLNIAVIPLLEFVKNIAKERIILMITKNKMCVLLTLAGCLTVAGCSAKPCALSGTEEVIETERDIMSSANESIISEDTEQKLGDGKTEEYDGLYPMEEESKFKDRVVTINNVDYRLGCTAQDFFDHGFELFENQLDENGQALVYPRNYKEIHLYFGDTNQSVTLCYNNSDDVHHDYTEMKIIGIEIPEMSTINASIAGVSIGTTESKMIETLGEPSSGFKGDMSSIGWYETDDTELQMNFTVRQVAENAEKTIVEMRLVDWSGENAWPSPEISERDK